MALLSACCVGTLMVVKGRARADGVWFISGAECGAIAGFTEVVKFWELDVAAFRGSSAGDGVISTESVMRFNGGR